MRLLLALAQFLLATSVACADQIVINLPGSPVELSNLRSYYVGGPPTFRFEVDAKNVSGQQVVAYSLSYLALDAVGELAIPPTKVLRILQLNPDDVRPNRLDIRGDDLNGQNVDQLMAHATGVSYVRKVRMADGSIWAADAQQVEAMLLEYDDIGLD